MSRKLVRVSARLYCKASHVGVNAAEFNLGYKWHRRLGSVGFRDSVRIRIPGRKETLDK